MLNVISYHTDPDFLRVDSCSSKQHFPRLVAIWTVRRWSRYLKYHNWLSRISKRAFKSGTDYTGTVEGKGTATHSAGMTHFSPEAHHEYQSPLEPSGILLSNLVETPCNPEYTNHHEEQSLEEGSVRGGSKKLRYIISFLWQLALTHFYPWVKREALGDVLRLLQEHITMMQQGLEPSPLGPAVMWVTVKSLSHNFVIRNIFLSCTVNIL